MPPAKAIPMPRRQICLSDRQRLAWLRLIRSQNVGPVTFRSLLNHFGGAQAALDALPELAKRGGQAGRIRICPPAEAEAELARATRLGARLIALGEANYPPFLAQLDVPPPLIYAKGRLELLAMPMVAIVGSRRASAINQKFAGQLAGELGQAGFVVVSGLAHGIDTAAHKGALERGTVAVLGGGIDITYPPENADLQRLIGERGVLLSEQPPGWKPRAQDFPRRNRIIAGLSVGVAIIEAARRSGSLITARLAAEQGRIVFAVPGHPLDPRAAGTNRLIRDGATLLTSSNDITEAVAPMLGHEAVSAPYATFAEDDAEDTLRPAPADISQDARATVLAALSPTPVDIDTLIRQCALPARDVNIILMELDLAGRIERSGPQMVALRA